MAMKELIERFALNSTAHGLPKVARATSLMGRVFWALICIAALSMFFIQGAQLLGRYSSFPKSVRLEVVNQPVPFPSVSVCNLRPMDIYTFGDVFFDYKHESRWDIKKDFNYTGRKNTTVPAFESLIVNYANTYNDYYNFAKIYAEEQNDEQFLWRSDRDLLSRMTLASNLNVTAAIEGGAHASQLIARCQYAGEKCSFDDFDWFLDPAYFNCYTFNTSRITESDHTMYEGPDNGLSLVLFVPGVQIMNYSGQVLDRMAMYQEMTLGGEGIRVVIHQKNTVPYPLTEGLDIPRGVSASIGIKLYETERMGRPHGNCTDRQTLENSTYTYTLASCKKSCLQATVIESCGCADISLPLTREDNTTFCSMFDPLPSQCRGPGALTLKFEQCKDYFIKWFDRVKCMKLTRANVSQNLSAWSTCQCKPPCHDMDYELAYSLSDWPMEEQSKLLVQDLLIVDKFHESFEAPKADKYFGSLLPNNTPFVDYKHFIDQKNLVRLNVYISGTSVIKVTEIEDYGFPQLVSDVGGQLGLWIGVSVITLVELVELVYNIVQYFVDKTPKDKSQKEKNETDESQNPNEPVKVSTIS